MKMFKKKDGFTLVELIVVIAILAILAGVAIPAYSGYLEKAKESKDITQLSAIKTAATAAYATDGEVTKIVVTDNGTSDTVVVTVNGVADAQNAHDNANFKAYLGVDTVDVTLESEKFKGGAQWDNTITGDDKGEWVKKS